jgi:predicted porin
MKKSLLALAVLGAFAGVASAQSSVTLFGVVDQSVNSIKNGNTTIKSLNSNLLNSNRLGFRGTEDLGGGLTAGFWLEAALNTDTGAAGNNSSFTAAGQFFDRRSTLSLAGGFGEIRLGRDYTPTFNVVSTSDVYGANGFGNGSNLYIPAVNSRSILQQGQTATTPAVVGVGTLVRADNAVSYFLPSGLGGLYGQVQIAAGEGTPKAATATAAAVPSNKYRGGRLGYAAGPLDVSTAISQTTLGSSDKFKVFNFGGSFDLGVAKVFGFWNQYKWANTKYTVYELSTSVPLGQGEFRASYAKGKVSDSSTGASLIGLEYIYNLSKRTALYTQYGRLSNKGGANLSLGGVTSAVDVTNGGFTSTGYGAGVRHSF